MNPELEMNLLRRQNVGDSLRRMLQEQFVRISVSRKAAAAGWLALPDVASRPADHPQVLIDSEEVATMFYANADKGG
jgi:predicted RNA binding protein with dsRBD fold (UPF0201 family)